MLLPCKIKNNYSKLVILCEILLKHDFHFIHFQVENEPPLEMTTAMFANISKGLPNNYVPYSDHGDTGRTFFSTPQELIQTYSLPSGIGATCVLESAQWNDSQSTKYQDSCYRAMSEFGVSPSDYNTNSLHYKYLKGNKITDLILQKAKRKRKLCCLHRSAAAERNTSYDPGLISFQNKD